MTTMPEQPTRDTRKLVSWYAPTTIDEIRADLKDGWHIDDGPDMEVPGLRSGWLWYGREEDVAMDRIAIDEYVREHAREIRFTAWKLLNAKLNASDSADPHP